MKENTRVRPWRPCCLAVYRNIWKLCITLGVNLVRTVTLSCSVPIGKTHLTVPQFPIYNMEIIVHSDACLLGFCFFSLSLVLLPYFGSFLFLIFFQLIFHFICSWINWNPPVATWKATMKQHQAVMHKAYEDVPSSIFHDCRILDKSCQWNPVYWPSKHAPNPNTEASTMPPGLALSRYLLVEWS